MQRTLRPTAAVSLLALWALVLACAAPPPPVAEEAVTPSTGPDVYQLRGEVVELPRPNNPMSSFGLRHEAIPRFRTDDGDFEPMQPMTMYFPVDDGLALAGIGVGDAVEVTLVVDWDGDPVTQITAVEKLPPGTELDFGHVDEGTGADDPETAADASPT